MDYQNFWSEENKSIKKSESFLLSEALPLPTSDALLEDECFGPVFRRKKSRVIRFYRLTTPVFPKDNRILEDRDVFSLSFVPCSLFQPNMKMLDNKQKDYFYFFCKKTEENIKVDTSFSYIILYICKILRSIELISDLPDSFYWLWETYRKEFPLLDKLCCDTLSDFCFYKNKTIDFEKISPIFWENDFRIKPFLLNLYLFDDLFCSEKKLNHKEINFILRTLTGESFRKSKAYRTNPRFSAACEETVFKAFEKGLFNKDQLNKNLFSIKIPSEVHTVRPLFPGLPEQEIVNVKINFCYVPLLHDYNIRFRFDEIIRYIENRMRGIFKIKNALSRIHISPEHKNFLEEILSPYKVITEKIEEGDFSAFAAQKPKEAKREFVLDPEKAREIEDASWEITQKLTESYLTSGEELLSLGSEKDLQFDQKYEKELIEIEKTVLPISSNEFWEFAASLTETEDLYLATLLYYGKESARRYALSQGAFAEALTAACNQKAIISIGDGVIDSIGNIYEDYRNDLKEVFLQPKGDA